jgi:hypothetical protein
MHDPGEVGGACHSCRKLVCKPCSEHRCEIDGRILCRSHSTLFRGHVICRDHGLFEVFTRLGWNAKPDER